MKQMGHKVMGSALLQMLENKLEVYLLGSLWLAVGQLDKRAFEGVTQNVCDFMTKEKVLFFIEHKHLFNAFSVLMLLGI